jgi:hypothetical protein
MAVFEVRTQFADRKKNEKFQQRVLKSGKEYQVYCADIG